VATFAAAGLLGALVTPADSVQYWLRGTFAAADRIAAVDGAANHSVNGLVTRLLGPGTPATALYVVAAAALVAATLVLAVRASRGGEELLALSLCGLCSAAAAPFAWSHHWVWVVPLLPALAARWATGNRPSGVALAITLTATLAVITALPGPAVGPIPSTGLISITPETYLLMLLALPCLLCLPTERPRGRGCVGQGVRHGRSISRVGRGRRGAADAGRGA
jgi:alpha-1,2-mannosyltransferase